MNFFEWLFATGEWPARSQCGQWSHAHVALSIISNSAIVICYVLIPIGVWLHWSAWRRFSVAPTSLAVMVCHTAHFIVTCGLTHLVGDVLVFWWPAYRFATLVETWCAVASMGCAWVLFTEPRRTS